MTASHPRPRRRAGSREAIKASSPRLRIALAQIDAEPGDCVANIEKAKRLIDGASWQGRPAGVPGVLLQRLPDRPGRLRQRPARRRRHLPGARRRSPQGITVAIGFIEETGAFNFYDSLAFIARRQGPRHPPQDLPRQLRRLRGTASTSASAPTPEPVTRRLPHHAVHLRRRLEPGARPPCRQRQGAHLRLLRLQPHAGTGQPALDAGELAPHEPVLRQHVRRLRPVRKPRRPRQRPRVLGRQPDRRPLRPGHRRGQDRRRGHRRRPSSTSPKCGKRAPSCTPYETRTSASSRRRLDDVLGDELLNRGGSEPMIEEKTAFYSEGLKLDASFYLPDPGKEVKDRPHRPHLLRLHGPQPHSPRPLRPRPHRAAATPASASTTAASRTARASRGVSS